MNSFLRNLLGLNKNDQEIGTFNNGISWEPKPPRSDDVLNIHYRGKLKEAGANEIFLHYGFDGWNQSLHTVKMEKLGDGSFGAAVKAEGDHEMNLCFKDNEDHWDNNYGNDWHIHLE